MKVLRKSYDIAHGIKVHKRCVKQRTCSAANMYFSHRIERIKRMQDKARSEGNQNPCNPCNSLLKQNKAALHPRGQRAAQHFKYSKIMMLQRYNKKARLQNSLAFFCCFLFNIGLHGFNGFFLSPDEPDEPDYFSFANG